jgi:hypothetical protein
VHIYIEYERCRGKVVVWIREMEIVVNGVRGEVGGNSTKVEKWKGVRVAQWRGKALLEMGYKRKEERDGR